MSDELQQIPIPDDIGLDQIVGAGSRVPAGRYVAKLIAIEESVSSKNNPQIACRWEIQSGEHAGEDALSWFGLSISPPKKAGGKFYAPGLMEMKMAFEAVGDPLPAGYRFPLKDPNACAKLVGKRLGRKNLDIAIIEEPSKNKDTGVVTIYTRVRILGVAGGTAKAAPASAPVDEENDLV